LFILISLTINILFKLNRVIIVKLSREIRVNLGQNIAYGLTLSNKIYIYIYIYILTSHHIWKILVFFGYIRKRKEKKRKKTKRTCLRYRLVKLMLNNEEVH